MVSKEYKLIHQLMGRRVAADVERPKPSAQPPYDDRVRVVLSECAKEMPRDAQGRFTTGKPNG